MSKPVLERKAGQDFVVMIIAVMMQQHEAPTKPIATTPRNQRWF